MSDDDRRRNFRAELRTVVNVYTKETRAANPPTHLRAWSEDISATGARLIMHEKLEGPRVWLKFIAQGQSESVIEAEIVRTGFFSRGQFRNNDKLNSYGVQFLRLLSDAEFIELSLDQVERITTDVKPALPKSTKVTVG